MAGLTVSIAARRTSATFVARACVHRAEEHEHHRAERQREGAECRRRHTALAVPVFEDLAFIERDGDDERRRPDRAIGADVVGVSRCERTVRDARAVLPCEREKGIARRGLVDRIR
jgi:hypothetical protein